MGSNLSWNIFFCGRQTHHLPNTADVVTKHRATDARLIFTTHWLPNAAWSAKGWSGLEIMRPSVVHASNCANSPSLPPLMQQPLRRKSHAADHIRMMSYHLSGTCLDVLALAFKKGKKEMSDLCQRAPSPLNAWSAVEQPATPLTWIKLWWETMPTCARYSMISAIFPALLWAMLFYSSKSKLFCLRQWGELTNVHVCNSYMRKTVVLSASNG